MRTPRVAVKALIVRDQQVLMNRFLDDHGQETFELPGGGQEHGEDQVAALIRECQEEIGALVEVHQVACMFEVMSDRSQRSGAPITPFHQVNVTYWCGLAEGEEPGRGTDPDPGQAGTAWLPLAGIGEHTIQPPVIAEWLVSDPSDRPVSLGVSRRGSVPSGD